MSETVPPSPRISVVLPVRDGERFLQEALDSVFAQTFTDFELICVDDDSSDATPEILARAKRHDGRVRVVTHRERRGLPASLDAGFHLARAGLHSWMGHDDRMRPAMLSRLHAFLTAHPGCDFVYAGYAEMDDAGAPLGVHAARPPHDLLLGNIVGRAFLYRARIWRDLGGHDHDLECVEDYDFCLRARSSFTLCPLGEVLFDYRIHSRSLTATRTAEIERLHDRLLEREIPREGHARREAEAWLHLMQLHPDPARLRYGAKALLAHPPTVAAHVRQSLRWLRAALAGPRRAS